MRKRTFKEKIVSALDIPKEVGLNYSRITMVGFDEIFIENLKGIQEYEDSKIRVNTETGLLIIHGTGLKIIEINSEDVFVRGKIGMLEMRR